MASAVSRTLKYVGASALKVILQAVFFFRGTRPKKILFESFVGRRVSCNPLALYRHIQQVAPGEYECVWAVADVDAVPQELRAPNVRICRYRSFEHWYHSYSAAALITNSPRSNEMPASRRQVQVQTWHGGGSYKKVGLAANGSQWISRVMMRRQFHRYDYFISSSQFFTDEVVRQQFDYSGDVLPVGMPRNDVLVRESDTERARIRHELGISDAQALVLYVPTWRDFDDSEPVLPVERVKRAYASRFGTTPVVAYRGHYFATDASAPAMYDMNLSDHPDMQELLSAADMVISDYSSVIWDFSFTGRPALLFVPDLDRYSEDRGFDVPLETWGFPFARAEDEFVALVAEHDQQAYAEAMRRHHETLGSFESGDAAARTFAAVRAAAGWDG